MPIYRGIKLIWILIGITCLFCYQIEKSFAEEVQILGGGAGGRFSDVEIDPNNGSIVYVTGDNAGAWTSTNGGATWTSLNNNGLVNYAIADLEIDPEVSTTVYVATQGGPFKSTNSGKSWISLRTANFPSITQDWNKKYYSALSCIKVCPQNTNIIYTGCGGTTKFRTREGLLYAGYRSTDGGATWKAIPNNKGGPDVSQALVVSSFAWNPENSNQVYMATNQGLFKSTDSGESWTKLTNGLPVQPVVAVEVVSAVPGRIYAATASGDSGGIFLSDNAGLSFKNISPEGDLNKRYCTDLQVVSNNTGHRLYASVYARMIMTDNSGVNWTILGAPPNKGFLSFWGSGIKQFSVAKKDPNQIVTVCDFIIRSADGGSTWVDSYSSGVDNNPFKNKGIVNTAPQAIFVNPNNNKQIMLAEYDIGLSRSLDGGITWKNYHEYFQANFQDSPWECFDIIMHNNTFYAMLGKRIDDFSWLMKSTDGENWEPVRKFDKANSKMAAVTKNGATRLFVTIVGQGIYRSDAPFTNWELEAFGNNAPVYITKDSKDVLYVALRYLSSKDGGIFKSNDLGENWVTIPNGDWFGDAMCLAVSPVDPKLIFVGTNGYQIFGKGGLFKSMDGGLTWDRVDKNISIAYEDQSKRRIKAVAFNSDGSKLFVGMDDGSSMDYNMDKGLFVSSDLGASFTKIQSLPSNRINCITTDPVDLNAVFVGIEGSGVSKILLPKEKNPTEKISKPTNLRMIN